MLASRLLWLLHRLTHTDETMIYFNISPRFFFKHISWSPGCVSCGSQIGSVLTVLFRSEGTVAENCEPQTWCFKSFSRLTPANPVKSISLTESQGCWGKNEIPVCLQWKNWSVNTSKMSRWKMGGMSRPQIPSAWPRWDRDWMISGSRVTIGPFYSKAAMV